MCVVVNVEIEYSSSWGELDGLELIDPPFGEVNSMVSQLILEQGGSKRPDTAEDEVELIEFLRAVRRCVLWSQHDL